MMLMVFFSSKISPLASTVIFCDKSPLATAVVTFAIFRTCAVKLPASPFTLSVRSFQVPFRTHFFCHAGYFRGEGGELVDHHVNGVFQFVDFALRFNGDFL